MRGPIEPFKIKMVERVRLLDQEQRTEAIKNAGYNTFLLRGFGTKLAYILHCVRFLG